MEKIRKLFGGVDLTWKKLIILAVAAAVYTAVMAILPITADTSFRDITVYFDRWIFFGIFIIMNSKSPKDSALKCFVFFLISQPLVYLVQILFGASWGLLSYYKLWIGWTLATLPMGYIGYYMKKDQWWGVIILLPMMAIIAIDTVTYMKEVMFMFPRHLWSVIFCIGTMFLYPIAIFSDKTAKLIGIIAAAVLSVGSIGLAFMRPPVYEAILISSNPEEGIEFDDTYKASFADDKYGTVEITYYDPLECYVIDADMKHGGDTQLILEAPDGSQRIFDMHIEMSTYSLEEVTGNQ